MQPTREKESEVGTLRTPETGRAIAFADDLTGALEVGALAVRRGWRTEVWLESAASDDGQTDLRVVDTCSRERSEQDAIAALSRALKRLGPPTDAILKKTDSLLRGHLAAELRLMRDSFPLRRLVYVPAYPMLGRIVKDGKLLLRNEDGTFHALADVMRVLAAAFPRADLVHVAGPAALARTLADKGTSVLVCDGESQREVDALAETLRPLLDTVVLAGSSGIFRELFAPRSGASDRGRRVIPELRSGVALIGSQHAVTAAQVAHAVKSAGAVLLEGEAEPAAIVEQWRQARDSGRWLIVRSDKAAPWDHALRRAISAIDGVPEELQPSAYFLSGGESAELCLRMLGIQVVHPLWELLPGVAMSSCNKKGKHLLLVSKSGAFGAPDTLRDIFAMLREARMGELR